LKIELPENTTSALTDPDLKVPQNRAKISEDIPITYVPASKYNFY